MHIAIVGAGPAGLSCAWHLRQSGFDVTVLEARDHVGGLARSFDWHGFSCDIATHRLFSDNPDVLAALNAIVPMHRHEKRSRIYFNGHWVSDPLDALDLAGCTPATQLLGLIAGYYTRPHLPDPASFRDFVTARYGHPLYDYFFRPYTEKLFGIPGHEVSVTWARSKVRLNGPLTRFRKTGKPPAHFYYPRQGGYGAIAKALHSALEDKVRLNCRVTGADVANNRLQALHYTSNGFEHSLPVDAVISTLPITVTGRMFGHSSTLRYRAMHAVYLLLDKPRMSENHWMYFMDDRFLANRLVEFKNMSDVNTPAETTVICAEVTNADTNLVPQVIEDLVRADFIAKSDVLDSTIVSEPFAYPLYTTDFESELAAISGTLEQIENLSLLGRAATFQHHEVDDSFALAQALAQKLGKTPAAHASGI